MKGLKFKTFIYALYIKKDVFIGYFDTYNNASTFANRYYKGNEAHVRPIEVWTLRVTP